MPCDSETARTEIMAALNTAWLADGESAAIPIKWPNVKSILDADRVGTTNDAPSWARLTIQPVTGEARSIGAGLWRNRGLITFEIYVPQGNNDKLAHRLVKVAANAFRKQTTTNGVSFFKVRPRLIGNDGLWYRMDLLSEYQHDEVV